MLNKRILSRLAVILPSALLATVISTSAHASSEQFDVRVDGWAHGGYSSEAKCQNIMDTFHGGGSCYSIMEYSCGFPVWMTQKLAQKVSDLGNAGHEVRVYGMPSGNFLCKSGS
jgi:hypothetical protein